MGDQKVRRTLPGVVPGLLRRGCPVLLASDVMVGSYWFGVAGCRGVVHEIREVTEGGTLVDIAVEDEVGAGALVDVLDKELLLDLEEDAGVDRALRWLAKRVGYDLEGQLGSPAFTQSPDEAHFAVGWWLNGWTEGSLFQGPEAWRREWAADNEGEAPETPPDDYGVIVVPGLDGVEDAIDALILIITHLA